MTKWRLDFLNKTVLDSHDKVDTANKRELEIGGKIKWKLGDRWYWRKYSGYESRWIDG